MDEGVDGAGAPVALGPAMWTSSPPGVSQCHAPLGARQRANRRSDAADRWREALGQALGCTVERSPTHGPARTSEAAPTQRRQRTTQESRGTTASARAQTAQGSRPRPVSSHHSDAGASSGSLPYSPPSPWGCVSQTHQDLCNTPATPARERGGLLDGASWCSRALDNSSRPCGGLRSSGVGFLSA
jgi:hypothetical protein